MNFRFVRFRYPNPATIEQGLSGFPFHDFVRVAKKGHAPRVDPCYLLNQAEGANFFLQWFSTSHDINFESMLLEHHRIACLGLAGNRPYRIPNPRGKWLEPIDVSRERIRYETTNCYYWRETFPGQFRWELEAKGLEHPSTDLLRLNRSQFRELRDAGEDSVAANMDWPAEARRPRPPDPIDGWRFHCKTSCRHPVATIVSYTPNHYFHRSAPREDQAAQLLAHVSELMDRLKAMSNSDWQSHGLLVLADYYHSAINLMPFANVNNSIFMAHVNAILRGNGHHGLQHANFDSAAMLSSAPTFQRYLLSHILRNDARQRRIFGSRSVHLVP